ncbi:uncharacterized protein G2W53_041327 [Senna tora]|uniref:ATP-dependent DNA helicase n=1 Tax=Senna tora TaxID=362788 RepID=A0A834SEX3_9FABA|nr:uncharacterized protein G2W53_041327 [Senna tora]
MDVRFVNGVGFPSNIMINILLRCGTTDVLSMQLVSRQWFFSVKHPYVIAKPTAMRSDHLNPTFLVGAHFVSAGDAYNRIITVTSSADALNNDGHVRLFLCNPATKRVRQIEDFFLLDATDSCDASVVIQLSQMLHSLNPLVKAFRSVKDHPSSSNRDNLRLKLIKKRTSDAIVYNLATGDEIAALIVESQRLLYIRLHQKDLQVDNYVTLTQALSRDIYTIEFPKRGLPHAHILIWLNIEHKLTNEALIDGVICAEIPDPDSNPQLYEAVKTFMIHGPCGVEHKSSPCMVNSKCSKHFPKKFIEMTSFDEDGYCKYRRRDTGHFVEKNEIKLDNKFVVPYNPTLLLLALCNSASNASSEDITDEIKMELSLDRLPFHLSDQQDVVFPDDAPIDLVVYNATMKQTKFLTWFEANKKYPKAKTLTYAQFPTHVVYKTDCHKWFERKSGHSIRRLFYVASGAGELHYLRLLLTFTKGPTSYEDIKTINGVLYPTFKDVCYVMGLLDDDKEYIEGILEGSKWSSASYSRKLFATLLIHSIIARPAYVWENTWKDLSDDVLLRERNRTRNPVASSGIASQLIPGVQGSDLAELIIHTKLIIWDEAPMAHRYCFEALDRSLRDIMHSHNEKLAHLPFGGKVLSLTQNMHLSLGNSVEENDRIAKAILSPTLDDLAQLKLKVGAPIMLLRHIDRSLGLCNGTRLILTRMSEHMLEVSIMSGKFKGEKVLIARVVHSIDYSLTLKSHEHGERPRRLRAPPGFGLDVPRNHPRDPNAFTILLWNIRGIDLHSSQNTIQKIVNSLRPTVSILSETRERDLERLTPFANSLASPTSGIVLHRDLGIDILDSGS